MKEIVPGIELVMLLIDFDIQDAYIANPGVSLAGSVSTLPLSSPGSVNSGCWRTPDGTALLIQPVQLTNGWGQAPKFAIGEYELDRSNWEQQTRRGPYDYFLHSLGPVAEAVTSSYLFPRNCGFFVENWFYAPSDDADYALFDMSFGQFALFVHSNGTADVYDYSTPTNPVWIGAGQISAQAVTNRFVQIGILPYRRNRLLIWSSMGGFFSVKTAATYDKAANKSDMSPGETGLHAITNAGPASFYNFATPTAACFSFSPLLYADSADLLTTAYQSSVPLAQEPSLIVAQGDQEMGTSIDLTEVAGWDANSPPTTWQYMIVLQGSNGSAGPGATLSSSPAMYPFSPASSITVDGETTVIGSGPMANLYTPFDYLNRVDADRALGNRQYRSNTIKAAIAATLRLDKDRGKSTFSFTLDNPLDTWTSLKDMQNRRVRVYLDLPENHGLAANTDDPDRGLIAANGGPIDIFWGYSDKIDFTDGTESRITVNCAGMIKKLRRFLMNSSRDYDGVAHTTAVKEVLQLAGFVGPQDVSGDFPQEQIYVYDDGVNAKLPDAGAGTEPAWRPRDGVTAEEFLDQIAQWSGWDLFESCGVWYYVPKDFEAAQALAKNGVVTINAANTLLSPNGGTHGQSVPNADVSMIAALAEPALRQSGEELAADDIYVIGMDADGNQIAAHYEATELMTDRTQPYYVGDRWTYILINSSLATQRAVNTACATLSQQLTKPTRVVEFSLPDFRTELSINSPVYIQNYGNALITGIDCNFGDQGECGDRYRKTQYLAELAG